MASIRTLMVSAFWNTLTMQYMKAATQRNHSSSAANMMVPMMDTYTICHGSIAGTALVENGLLTSLTGQGSVMSGMGASSRAKMPIISCHTIANY